MMRDDATTGRALDEAYLEKVGFIELFDGAFFLREGCGKGVQAYWAAAELFNHRFKNITIRERQTFMINTEKRKCLVYDRFR